MAWIIVDLRIEPRHDPQLAIISTEMNIEIIHVVLGALPPLLRVTGDVVGVLDDGGLAVL